MVLANNFNKHRNENPRRKIELSMSVRMYVYELTKDLLSQANIKAAEIQNTKIAWSKAKNSIYPVSRQQWSADWTAGVTSSTITKSFLGIIDGAKILQLHLLTSDLNILKSLKTFLKETKRLNLDSVL